MTDGGFAYLMLSLGVLGAFSVVLAYASIVAGDRPNPQKQK